VPCQATKSMQFASGENAPFAICEDDLGILAAQFRKFGSKENHQQCEEVCCSVMHLLKHEVVERHNRCMPLEIARLRCIWIALDFDHRFARTNCAASPPSSVLERALYSATIYP